MIQVLYLDLRLSEERARGSSPTLTKLRELGIIPPETANEEQSETKSSSQPLFQLSETFDAAHQANLTFVDLTGIDKEIVQQEFEKDLEFSDSGDNGALLGKLHSETVAGGDLDSNGERERVAAAFAWAEQINFSSLNAWENNNFDALKFVVLLLPRTQGRDETTEKSLTSPWGHVVLEHPDLLSKSLLLQTVKILADLCNQTTTSSNKLRKKRPPLEIRKLPPNPWGAYSIRGIIFERFFDFDRSDPFEDPTGRFVHEFLRAYDQDLRLVVTDPPANADPNIEPGAKGSGLFRMRNLVYALQLCTRAAAWTVESKPFRCTLLFRSGEYLGPRELNLSHRPSTHRLPSDEIRDRFAFGNPEVRARLELVQTETAFLEVDLDELQMGAVSAFRSAHLHHRGSTYRKFATETGNTVVHLCAGRVEVYFPKRTADRSQEAEDVQLVYEGGEWIRQPFRQARNLLRDFFSGIKDQTRSEPILRIIGAFVSLFDSQASSILVFANFEDDSRTNRVRPYSKPGMPASADKPVFRYKDDDPRNKVLNTQRLLSPLRKGELSLLTDIDRPAKQFPIKQIELSAFAALLRSDGAHVIDHDGNLRLIAYQIITPEADPEGGTGRSAARVLSKYLRNPSLEGPDDEARGFVVQVSSDRLLHIFVEGEEVDSFPEKDEWA